MVTCYKDCVHTVNRQVTECKTVKKKCGQWVTEQYCVPGRTKHHWVREEGEGCFDPCTCATTHKPGKWKRVCEQCPSETRCRKVWKEETVCETVPVTKCVKECVHEKVPYTVCKKVPHTVCQKVPYTVSRRVAETTCKKVPYTVTENEPTTVSKKVPASVMAKVRGKSRNKAAADHAAA